jgi:predicted TIM-barrel fold metal-dependent hydrolase
MGRFMQLGHAPADAKRVPPDSIPQTLRRLYFEVANSANKASISAVMEMADPAHMLFGSDYPYVPVGATEGGLMKVGLSPQEIQAILRDNAVRLMPSLKAA